MPNDWKSKYDYIEPFHEGLAAVQRNDQWGFVDTTGKEVVPPKYDNVEFFHEGLALVKLKKKFGFIDQQGHEYWDMTEDEARWQMGNR